MNTTQDDYREERPSEIGPGAPGAYGAGAGSYGGPPPPQPGAAPRYDRPAPRLPSKSPALASFLSLMPGLGQIYIGYYQRGFTHMLIAAGMITALSTMESSHGHGHATGLEPLFGISLGFFWLYNIIDAGRRATLYNMALESGRAPEMPEDVKMPKGGSLAGGVILIALGLLIFLNTMFDFSLDWLADWWPLGLIILGAWMVFSARKSRPREP